MKVALVGYRGCGKTTIGRKLADRLWQSYIDIDDLIVARAGKTIRDIFQDHGEEYFRQIEAEVLREVCQLPDFVLGVGGGTVIREENRELLKGAAEKIIYLRCDPEELLKRIKADTSSPNNRPALTQLGGGIEEIRLKLGQREPLYREIMDVELDVTRLSPDEAMNYIARML